MEQQCLFYSHCADNSDQHQCDWLRHSYPDSAVECLEQLPAGRGLLQVLHGPQWHLGERMFWICSTIQHMYSTTCSLAHLLLSCLCHTHAVLRCTMPLHGWPKMIPCAWHNTLLSDWSLTVMLLNSIVTAQMQNLLFCTCNRHYLSYHSLLNAPLECVQGAVAVVQASPGAAAAAPAEGLPPGLSVTVVVTPVDNSTAATPLTAQASPAPARRLLADTVTSSGTGVDVNITITAPASDMNNITALVSQAVQSGQVQQQLQAAGEPRPHDLPSAMVIACCITGCPAMLLGPRDDTDACLILSHHQMQMSNLFAPSELMFALLELCQTASDLWCRCEHQPDEGECRSGHSWFAWLRNRPSSQQP